MALLATVDTAVEAMEVVATLMGMYSRDSSSLFAILADLFHVRLLGRLSTAFVSPAKQLFHLLLFRHLFS